MIEGECAVASRSLSDVGRGRLGLDRFHVQGRSLFASVRRAHRVLRRLGRSQLGARLDAAVDIVSDATLATGAGLAAARVTAFDLPKIRQAARTCVP